MGRSGARGQGTSRWPSPVPAAAAPTPLPSRPTAWNAGCVPAQTGPGPASTGDAGIKGAGLPAKGTGRGTKAVLFQKRSPAAGEEPAAERRASLPAWHTQAGPGPGPSSMPQRPRLGG